VVEHRFVSVNVGITPFGVPVRADRIAIALELPFAVPQRQGGEVVHHWLFVADIDCFPDGDCRTGDLDKVYEAGPDGGFTKLVGSNAAGPNFDGLVDGFRLSNAGYKLWGFSLQPSEGTTSTKSWRLKLGLMREPKPVLRE
jgi:hypothetical protein